MKYKVRDLNPPNIVVEFSTDDGAHKQALVFRVDLKPDGTLPVGQELDALITSYAPPDLVPPTDPYAGIDWSSVHALVEPWPVAANAKVPTVINDFLIGKGLDPASMQYAYSIHDVTNDVALGDVYADGVILVKVDPAVTTVLEYYTQSETVDGVFYDWVSRDTTTGAVADRYQRQNNAVLKSPKDQTETVLTTYGGIDNIPAMLRTQVQGFPFKDRIQAWSSKTNGLVVEYIK